jgi:Domain of unknown function (DUF6249)
MMHLLLSLVTTQDSFSNYGMWIFLSVGAVALFAVFIPLVTFIDSRQKEREAFYKSETLRRIAEASPDGSRAAIELLHEQNRISLIKTREGLKIGGIITLGVGVGVVCFLVPMAGLHVGLCGLIPAFVGLAMLVYVYVLAEPVI